MLRTPKYVDEYSRRSTGIHSSRLRLYPEQFLKIEMILPPKDEQERILLYIEEETGRIEAAIARAKQEIELIREYRTRLISDVVTGKLNVRDVVLPEVEEDEAVPVPLDPDSGDLGEMAMVKEVSHADH